MQALAPSPVLTDEAFLDLAAKLAQARAECTRLLTEEYRKPANIAQVTADLAMAEARRNSLSYRLTRAAQERADAEVEQ